MIIAADDTQEWKDKGTGCERIPVQTMEAFVSFPMAESERLIDMEGNLMTAKRIINHMGKQINDLLEYTKMEKGVQQPKRQPFSKKDLYKQMEYLVQPMCEDKKLTYEIDFERLADKTIQTDKRMLVQLLWQLMDNAAQYSNEGGHISIEGYTAEENENEVKNCFVIRDSGIGMSERFQQYIFQPFMRERNDMSCIVDGTGLGLYIVYQITKLLGGLIEVDSREDQGTSIRVSINFPVCKSAQTVNGQVDVSVLQGKRVLLCEEYPEKEKQTRKSLEEAGMLVEVATDGQNVIDLFKKSEAYYYDAILVNVRMSSMNGFEVTKGIRQLDRTDAYLIPVIALIMYTYDESIETPIAAGMDAQIEEPIDVRALVEPLSTIWKEYKVQM